MNLSQSASLPPQQTDRRLRILFVDDEPLLTRLGGEFLRRLGYDAVTSTSPQEALLLFGQDAFDCVVTDLTMPQMSGIDLARAVQGIRPEVPVVLTTAFHQKLEGKSPLDLGFNSLLLKPYSIQALSDAIRKAMASTSAA